MKKALLLLIVLPGLLLAQAVENVDVWEPLKFFVGEWEGKTEGDFGVSTARYDFQFVLRDKFLQVKNKSVFKPQEKNPQGDVHEDLGLISYDRIRNKLIFRQFHVESFINQYVLTISEDSRTLSFVTEQIENLPPGWRAKLTYTIVSDDEFHQSFDIARPDNEFACMSTGIFKRVK